MSRIASTINNKGFLVTFLLVVAGIITLPFLSFFFITNAQAIPEYGMNDKPFGEDDGD